MLKVGIVGLTNHEKYTNAINDLDLYSVLGIYDQSFSIQNSAVDETEESFEFLLENCDLLIFTVPNNFFYPLIIKALQCSVSILLGDTYNFSYEQISNISKLAKEANTNIFTLHNYLSNQIVEQYINQQTKPLFIQDSVEIKVKSNLLKAMYKELIICLFLINSNIRNTKINIFTANSQVPDLYNVVLEFDNGCFCNITTSSVGNYEQKQMRIVGTNSQHKLDFNEMISNNILNNKTEQSVFKAENNTEKEMTKRQLKYIFSAVKNSKTTYYPLYIELTASKILTEITNKLKICNKLV